MAFTAVHQRIRETAEMSGCHPDLRIHQDRRIEAVDISGFGEDDFRARNIRIEACTLGPEATMKLAACEDVKIDIRRAE